MPLDLSPLLVPATTALLLVDLQHGLLGPAERQNYGPDVVEEMIANAERLARTARALGMPVVHCTKVERADGAGASVNTPLWRRRHRSGAERLVVGSAGAAVLAPLGPEASDLVVPRSRGASPFTGTELDPVLRNLGVKTLVVSGVSLNVGVLTTCTEGVSRGYEIVVASDAVAGIPHEYGRSVLQHSLRPMAVISTADEVCSAWTSSVA
ncbi:cysteine hydrolase family protein [Pseudonocardia sp. GCM10023141]|uniref:cysteine hydrolase family protein n=1 Tax=Pseudonocardia sp. GCM10023141 TaxID=3252653 RepID=UPI003620B862